MTVIDRLITRIELLTTEAVRKAGQAHAQSSALRAGKGWSSNEAFASLAVLEGIGRQFVADAGVSFRRALAEGVDRAAAATAMSKGLKDFMVRTSVFGVVRSAPDGHKWIAENEWGRIEERLQDLLRSEIEGLAADPVPHWTQRKPMLWATVQAVISAAVAAIVAGAITLATKAT